MEQQTHYNRRKIGVPSKPFWQRNNHARESRNRHKCFTTQAESKRVFFTPLEWFHLIQIFEALPTQWRKSLTSCGPKSGKTFFLYDQIKLYLKNQAVQIENVLSKNVYSEITAGYETRPTAQARFVEHLDWHDIYKFQYRILNRYLKTNSFLYKTGLAKSPSCTFCKQESESLEHLLIICSCTKSLWSDFITWSNQLNISVRDLSESDILFGFWQRKEDNLFINHMLVLAKQHIYELMS